MSNRTFKIAIFLMFMLQVAFTIYSMLGDITHQIFYGVLFLALLIGVMTSLLSKQIKSKEDKKS